MKLAIPYPGKNFSLEIPGENLLCVAGPNDAESAGDEEGILTRALGAAVTPAARGDSSGGKNNLGQFLEGGRKVLVIINDATRPTPTAAMLKAMSPVFKAAGIEPRRLTILVATGAHRAPSEEEYRQILGESYQCFRSRCVAHDSRNADEMVLSGFTRRGTPVILNRRIPDADRIVVTGSVEPHYFAGFTGGAKAFLPGVAAYESVKTNHGRALSPGARALALEGNPVREDMDDAAGFIRTPVFSLMTVLDKGQKTAAAFSGDLMTSFREAAELSKKIFCVSVPEKADIVVSVAKHPMDIDLYQSQKAIDNGALALRDGGTLILVASCRDGLGDKTYAGLLASASSPAEALEKIRREYKLGYHKAAKMAMVSGRARITAVTELPAAELERMFIGSAPSPQAALDEALKRAKDRGAGVPKVLVLPDGCVTVPVTDRGS
ncbi:MAG: nickel-dependent lactate racemase [Treponema sp.]|nr:nickel-dependent lactate racemase [Treponema sp.]